MNREKWNIRFISDSSILIESNEPISSALSLALEAIHKSLPIDKFENIHPAYRSLLLDFDPHEIDAAELLNLVKESVLSAANRTVSHSRVVEVPVVYGGEAGLDLERVAAHAGLTSEEVIKLHTEADYRVAFLGFAPGFPYLTGMNPKLQCPRLSSPRLKVPAGSVAIGGAQTGIYPEESPGGWLLIGKTTRKLFDPMRDQPSLLMPGDRLRFCAVKS